MPATDLSPNADNYYLGTGEMWWRPLVGGVLQAWRHLGNAPEYLFESTVEIKEHRSSMHASRMVDKSVVTGQTGQATVTLEEWTAPNLGMWLLGEVTGVDEAAVINIGKVTKHEGQLAFVGSNEHGPQWNIWLPNVAFRPNGSLNPLQDDWGAMQVIGAVAISPLTDSFGLAARDGANLAAAELPAWGFV